jgi:putative membrane protein
MSRYHRLLLVVVALAWAWAAWRPVFPQDWLLENLLVFAFVPIVLLVSRYFRLSDVSYTLIALFTVLHLIGAHYTYAEVPFGLTLQRWLGADRNMYDRLVHFGFGFLLAYPVREVFMRVVRARGFWSYYLPLDLVAAGSAAYEILEWLAARRVAPSAGLAFLGSQGDIWDAQKDMLMAITGAAAAMVILFVTNWALDHNHWREFRESFRIEPEDRPLGEVRLRELLRIRGGGSPGR